MAVATLLVLQGPDEGARHALDPRLVGAGDRAARGAVVEFGIGRGTANAVRLRDTEVSRRHAVLTSLPGDDGPVVRLRDAGSSNGTFVNGRRSAEADLKHGDRVQVGRSVLLFSAGEPDSADGGAAVDLVGPVHATPEGSGIVATMPGLAQPHGWHRSDGSSVLRQTASNLQVLYRVTEESVRPSLSIEQLLGRLLDLSIESVHADRGCVLLRGPADDALTPAASRNRAGGAEAPPAAGPMPVSRSIVDYVLRTGQGVRTGDAAADERFSTGNSILRAHIGEALCVPLRGRDAVEGVIYVDTTYGDRPPDAAEVHAGGRRFTDEHLRLLAAIGRQAALAVENVRYQRALVRAERLAAIGETIAVLSHHIKNILQGLGGGGHLVELGLEKDDRPLIRKGWDIVERNQSRIFHLVTDMLTFGKERRACLKAGPLNDTVAEVVALAAARAEEDGVELRVEPDARLPAVHFDAEALHRAVLNVVLNGIDAAAAAAAGRDDGSGGTVVVSTGLLPGGDFVHVTVADDGTGLPADRVEHIFEPFESSKGARGTGLGLAVARKILREHGGDVSVETEPGRGSRFTMAWPCRDDDGGRAAETVPDMGVIDD